MNSCRIQILSDTVANQIAAGEVVERPASVVKELVENALDAEATSIEIDLHRGGKTLLRVIDNGMGMNQEEAKMALQRHATSKLRTLNDLLTLESYGFRGEALPSIASIAYFKLLTRTTDEKVGTEVAIDHGRLIHVKETATQVGTQIEVRSIFSNIPARRKFLRSDSTEWHHIEQLLRAMTLTRLNTAWSIRHNDELVYHLPSAPNLKHRLEALFGSAWASQMIDVSLEDRGISIEGMTGQIGIGRADRNQTFFFVNQRLIQSPILNAALIEGYESALPAGRYPPAVLFLKLPSAQVDINVHPSKKEVRFHDPSFVSASITRAVRQALQSKSVSFYTPLNGNIDNGKEKEPIPFQTPSTHSLKNLNSSSVHSPHSVSSYATPGQQQATFQQVMPLAPSVESNSLGLQLLGSTLGRYILAEHEKGLVLIDQRAAHERILFEKLESQMKEQPTASQSLLLPATMELNPLASERLTKHQSFLQNIGISLHHLGGTTWMIDALPSFLNNIQPTEWIETILADEELEEAFSEKPKQAIHTIWLKIMARHSVPHYKNLNPQEAQKLMHDLHACNMPYTDPSGRPTMILLQRNEISSRFGRKSL